MVIESSISRPTDTVSIPLFHSPRPTRTAGLLSIIVLLGFGYGACMGMFGLGHDRELQILYSATKVPILLLATFVIALPSFFVMNTLLGVRGDFPEAVRAHLQAQAAITIVLICLAPLTLMWYLSTDRYHLSILFNAAMFGIASAAGQVVLSRLYRPLIARNPRHRTLLRAWLCIYAFVGIQMGWVLRPFIGQPGSPTRYFRDGAWGNAYVELFGIVRAALN
jgi:chromate transport protein ChrA